MYNRCLTLNVLCKRITKVHVLRIKLKLMRKESVKYICLTSYDVIGKTIILGRV